MGESKTPYMDAHPAERRPNVIGRFDRYIHATFTTGWQTLTKCGRRVTWLDVRREPAEWTDEPVSCRECLAIMERE